MNILLVSPLPPPSGGMATWTEQYLRDSDGVNTVYTVNTAFIGERALHKGGRMKIVPEIKRMVSILRNYLKILRTQSVDVVHINSSCSKTGILRDALCVVFANKKHIVFHCHCNIQDQLKGRLAIRIGKYVFNRADCVLVLNKASLDYVSELSGSRVRMIPNAIAHDLIAPKYVVSDSLRNIVYVGHVKPKKGILEIIEAASMEEDIRFHLVGPVSDEIKKVYAPKNIVFYGRKSHDEAMEIMKKADAFLFPSYTEGFSMVMLEAMATGLPIIASDVGSNADMIETKGGVIIKPQSSNEIVQAIENIRPPKVRAEMSKWNLHKVESSYRDDAVFKQIQEVYHEICVPNLESD